MVDDHQRVRRLLERADTLSTAWVYLALALAFGVVVLLATPAFQVFDEQAHYIRAWSVAQGELLAGADGTVSVPENVAALPGDLRFIEVMRAGEAYPSATARRLLWEPISGTQTRVVTSAASYGPVGYLPQAAGILAARAIGRSPLLGLYLGRAANLVVCVLIVFFGLRLLPRGRALLAVIALFPLVVTLMASLSVDGLAIAGWIFFLCLVLHLVEKETVPWRWLVPLLALIPALVTIKAGYALIAALVLLLRPRQLAGWPRYVGVVLGGLALAAVTTLVVSRFGPDAAHMEAYSAAIGSPTGDDPERQLGDILRDPMGFLDVLKVTYRSSAVLFARQMVGILGWGAVGISDLVAFTYVGVLVVFMMQDEPPLLRWWQRLVLAGAAAGTVLFVSAALYVYFTPYGEPQILGLQGRYYLPALPLVVFAIYGIRLRRPYLRVAVLAALAMLGLLATLSLLLRTY